MFAINGFGSFSLKTFDITNIYMEERKMKKKFTNKLIFNKTTVATLNEQEQKLVKGGDETDFPSCWTWQVTYCGTCETCISECGGSCRPTICENTCPLACPD